MPCSEDQDSLDEYSKILQEISSISIKSDTQYLIIGGDWNADPIRGDSRTRLFKEFIKNENLYNASELNIANVPYTFMATNHTGSIPSTSKIDHFLVSPNMKHTIMQY